MLASESEKEYMSVRFKVELEESSSAFGLLAWRKSCLLCLILLTGCVLICDIYQIYYTSIIWAAAHEVSTLPTHHGISGFEPGEMYDDYVSDRTQVS